VSDLAQTSECCEAETCVTYSESRNSNTEYLKRSKEKQKDMERRKENQDGTDDPEYGAGKH
jgi:hypothetical protein